MFGRVRLLHEEQNPMNVFECETFPQRKNFSRPFPLLNSTIGIYANIFCWSCLKKNKLDVVEIILKGILVDI